MRRSEFYKVKRGDNLADPGFWNDRFEDIDLRIHRRELDAEIVDRAVDDITAVALNRIDQTITPLVGRAQTLLADTQARTAELIADAQVLSDQLIANANALVAEVHAALEAAQNFDYDGGTF